MLMCRNEIPTRDPDAYFIPRLGVERISWVGGGEVDDNPI